MKEKIKKIALKVAMGLVVYTLGSSIIIGLTFVDWNWLVSHIREGLLIANGPLFILGLGLCCWAES